MNRDKKVLYLSSSLLCAVLFAAFLLTSLDNSKFIAAALLLLAAVLIRILIRKRSSHEISYRTVFSLTVIFAFLYVAGILMSRLHFGSVKNPYLAESNILLTVILPLTVLIVSSELIRSVFLMQDSRLAGALAYVICVLSEVLAFSGMAGITSMNRFMDLVGLTLFPALSANLYYHYLSRHYGMASPIAFRLITTLYIYVVPTETLMSDALLALIKIFVPMILLILTAALFEKGKKNALRKSKKLSTAATVFAALIVLAVTMLVSGQFRYGAMVIATDSMTGEINRGDVIIYERYENQKIEEGQVIVFDYNDVNVVHRVVKIDNTNGERHYYTRGDANDANDSGYRTDADILGLTDLKLAYVGYPTLWLNEIIAGGQP